MKQTDFAQYLKKYIRIYLPGIKVCSSRTIEEYDRVFKIFIYFLDEYEKFDALKFTMKLFNKELIEKFLFYLEKERNCSNKTINHRHSVINSFCKFVCREAPSLMFQLQAIIGLPFRKEIQEFSSYATPEGISLILSQIPTNTKTGIRDLAMFSFMYDSGCRVSELCDLKPKNLRLVSSPIVYITGKGGKCRTVPLQQKDVEILGIYMKIYNLNKTNTNECYLFPNHNGYRITRQSVGRILKEYTTKARAINSELIPEKFSCHSLRHSSAMALVQANANIIYIRDFLGHSSINTTDVYLRGDNPIKREAIKKALNINSPEIEAKKWKKHGILDWLENFNTEDSLGNL